MSSSSFTLLYFAAATSYTRKQQDIFSAPLPLNQLYSLLEKRYPGITQKVLSSSALTVNLDYVDVEEERGKGERCLIINVGDEVAIIPPNHRHGCIPRAADSGAIETDFWSITPEVIPSMAHIQMVMLNRKSTRQDLRLTTTESRIDMIESHFMAQQIPRTIIYKTIGGVEIPLDVYLPATGSNVPVLLWFHGGGLLQSKRTNIAPHHLRGIERYQYAFVSADYRLAPQVGVAEIYEDVRDCIAFVRNKLSTHVGKDAIDTSRLAVSGSSAGGYLAFMAGLYVEPKPSVILPIYPITDPLGTFFTTPQARPFGGSKTSKDIVAPFLDPNSEVVTDSSRTSPRNHMYTWMQQEAILKDLLHIKPGDDTFRIAKNVYKHKLPPTYIVHGDMDSAVGVEQADEVVGVMKGLGMLVEYERMHGVEHLFDRQDSVELEKMYHFFLQHV